MKFTDIGWINSLKKHQHLLDNSRLPNTQYHSGHQGGLSKLGLAAAYSFGSGLLGFHQCLPAAMHCH